MLFDAQTHLTHAVRALRRNPGFALSALAILALGIGANTAIFGIVNAVLLKPMPFPDPGSVVSVMHVPPPRAFPGIKVFAVSAANYLDWRKQNTAFESMAVIGARNFRLGGGSRPQAVPTTLTVPDLFSLLRVQPEYGRAFTHEECLPGRDGVLVISRGFAERQFGSAAGALGRTVELSGRIRRIIGVMPASFHLASWFPLSTDAWAPLAWSTNDAAVRGNHNYVVVARLKRGVSLREAQSQMNVISDRLAREYPEENTGWGAVVMTLREDLFGDVRPALLTLLGAVGLVLLIACANTANLVLVRTIARRKELAIRSALGAGTGQVMRPVLLETMVLALAGGGLGMLLARSGQALVMKALAAQMPAGIEVQMDSRVLAFTLVVSVLTGLMAGFIASWRLTRVDLNDSLKQGSGRTDTAAGGRTTRFALVVAETGLSLMLLVGAGLMIRSLAALGRVDPGFDASNLLTMSVRTPSAKSEGGRTRFYDDFLANVRTLPGVAAAAAIDTLPLGGGGSQQPVVVEGRPGEVFALQPNVAVRKATPGYVGAMRIPLVAGRDLEEADTLGKSGAVLISQAMARQFWPGENAIGKRFRISFTPEIVRQVVGVVGDIKERGLDVMEPVSMLYVPLLQVDNDDLSVVVRASFDPARIVPAIADTLRRIDPEIPLRRVRPISELVDDSLGQHRFSMYLFAALAGLAMTLAAVGVYSVLAYNVRTRAQEIGIRLALGAGVQDVVRLVVVEGMRPVCLGILGGAFGAWILSGLIAHLVYGVAPTDPYTFASVASLLAAVALFACLIPAYRATRVEPVAALRGD